MILSIQCRWSRLRELPHPPSHHHRITNQSQAVTWLVNKHRSQTRTEYWPVTYAHANRTANSVSNASTTRALSRSIPEGPPLHTIDYTRQR